MRSFVAVALAGNLLMSTAFAASVSPLPAGKPAGVKIAQVEDRDNMMLLVGVGIVAAGIALVASSSARAPLVAAVATTTATTTTADTTTTTTTTSTTATSATTT